MKHAQQCLTHNRCFINIRFLPLYIPASFLSLLGMDKISILLTIFLHLFENYGHHSQSYLLEEIIHTQTWYGRAQRGLQSYPFNLRNRDLCEWSEVSTVTFISSRARTRTKIIVFRSNALPFSAALFSEWLCLLYESKLPLVQAPAWSRAHVSYTLFKLLDLSKTQDTKLCPSLKSPLPARHSSLCGVTGTALH